MTRVVRNIQGLRAVAVLSVIVFHLQNIERRYSADYVLPDIFQLGATGVDIFFLISGFIMVTVTRSDAAGRQAAGNFLLHRAIRIYPLYWLINALVLAGMVIQPDIVRVLPDAPGYLLKSLLLLPQQDLPVLSIGWTLIHEMYFYAVFTLLLLAPGRWRWPLLYLWPVAGLAGWLLLEPTLQEPWLYLATNPLTFEFVAGCAIARWIQQVRLPHPAILLWAGAACAAASWWWWSAGTYREFPVGGMRVVHFLLPAALLLAGAVTLEKEGQYCRQIWQRIGDASYSLYLTHILLLSAAGRLWQKWSLPDSPLDNLFCLPVFLLLTVAGGMLCHQWVEKPLMTTLRRLAARTA